MAVGFKLPGATLMLMAGIALGGERGAWGEASAIEVAPGPEAHVGDTPVNDALARAPGVVEDAYGHVSLRGNHGKAQYRLDDLLLPEGVTGLGTVLDTRFADSITLLTGVLPAQYGYRALGVVDIHLRKGEGEPGGRLNLQGGSHERLEPSLELAGGLGAARYYLTGSYLRDGLGLPNPTAAAVAIHDATQQGKGFAFAALPLTPTLDASVMAGYAGQAYQVPAVSGKARSPLAPAGTPEVPSEGLDDNVDQTTQYALLALKGRPTGDLDYRLALSERWGTWHYQPDPRGGDLTYQGRSSTMDRSGLDASLQVDGAYRGLAAHGLKVGLLVNQDRATMAVASLVYPVDAMGATSSTPIGPLIDAPSPLQARLTGLYAQDDWQATDHLTVQLGLRFDDLAGSVSTNQLSPRLNLLWHLSPDTTARAGYARYFTPPSVGLAIGRTPGLYANTTGATRGATGDPVLPERDHYLELGISHRLTPSLTLGLSGYHQDAVDLLDQGVFSAVPLFTEFNYDHGVLYGAEVTASYDLAGWSAHANLNVGRAIARGIASHQELFSPEELAYDQTHDVVPENEQTVTLSAGLSGRWLETQLSTNLSLGSGAMRVDPGRGPVPGYAQLDLAASRRLNLPLVGTIDARASVTNALDAVALLNPGSSRRDESPAYGPRRSVSIGLSKAF